PPELSIRRVAYDPVRRRVSLIRLLYHFTGVRGSPGVALMAIGRAAENCDELAPLHSITSSARASSDGGSVMPRTLAAIRLMITSLFPAGWTGKSRCRNAMLKTAHGGRKLRRQAQLMSVFFPRAHPAVERSPALPGRLTWASPYLH